MDAKQHKKNEPYTANNPIPNVARFFKEQSAKLDPKKDGIQDISQRGKETRRTVNDPTTKSDVEIQDVDTDFVDAVDNPQITIPKANIQEKKFTGESSATGLGERYRQTQDELAPPNANPATTADVPIGDEKTNVLFHATPEVNLEGAFERLETHTKRICIATIVGTLGVQMFIGGWFGSIIVAFGISLGIWLWMRQIQDSAQNELWDTEKKRGETATLNLIPESVEWMNSLIAIVWKLVNPDIFASMADTLEDVMQASAPRVIENVRVTDIGQGSNPIRILSLRALPDSTVGESKKQEERAMEEDSFGDYYNIECAFAYHARPNAKGGLSQRAHNLHLQIVFYLGIKGVVGLPLPIWVELKGLIGTVRLRLQLTPDPPFLKNVTFTLMGLPKVLVSAVPMTERGVNVLNLPLISSFVNNSIAAAANEYVAPKSMSMDLSKILVGDDIKKKTDAIGVIYIYIDSAEDLSAQDKHGSSDAYITVAYSKYGKPMYSTRVIVNDLNPIWNECTAILVLPEQLKAQERLSVQLWDSDRMTADDIVGRVEFNLHELIQNGSRIQKRTDTLQGEDEGTTMPGKLHWRIGYFPLAEIKEDRQTHGKDISLPKDLRDKEDFQNPKGTPIGSEEHRVIRTPPDPEYPSGIVSIIAHQIINLEVQNPSGSFGRYQDHSPGQHSGENTAEESVRLPSAYCLLLLNDQLIFRTRTKVITSKPIYNAGAERFIADWRNAIVTIAVRDDRKREHSPLLGLVSMKLSDIFQTSSQVTGWYPLAAGLGYGRIRISLLFRSVTLQLEKNLLGWNIGTVEFKGEKFEATTSKVSSTRIKLITGGSKTKISRSACKSTEKGVEWAIASHNMRLPIHNRYMTPLRIEFYSRGHTKAIAHSMLWLMDVIDNNWADVDIPIFQTNNPNRLVNNYIFDKEGAGKGMELEEIGRLRFVARFKAGLDSDHKSLVKDNDERETLDTFDASVSAGLRRNIVRRETNQVVETLREGNHVDSDSDIEDQDNIRFQQTSGHRWETEGRDGNEEVCKQKHEKEEDIKVDQMGNELKGAVDFRDGEEESDEGDYPELSEKDLKDRTKRTEQRKQRGMFQSKLVRNMAFVKDEIAVVKNKVKARVSLDGRIPDVETEI